MFTNYKYVVTPTKIIALSTYAGRTVRGIAKCHPNDTFNEEFGKALAAARCNEKIAEKRYARARKKYFELLKEVDDFQVRAREAEQYYRDSYIAYHRAIKELGEIPTPSKNDD